MDQHTHAYTQTYLHESNFKKPNDWHVSGSTFGTSN